MHWRNETKVDDRSFLCPANRRAMIDYRRSDLRVVVWFVPIDTSAPLCQLAMDTATNCRCRRVSSSFCETSHRVIFYCSNHFNWVVKAWTGDFPLLPLKILCVQNFYLGRRIYLNLFVIIKNSDMLFTYSLFYKRCICLINTGMIFKYSNFILSK